RGERQHRRAANLAGADAGERLLRLLETEHLDLGANGVPPQLGEEVAPVGAREVRNRANRALPHRSSYGNDGMSVMWMPAQTTVPPRASAASACGTSSPAGAKMIAASSSAGRSPAAPAHSAPSSTASDCARSSPARVNANTRRPCAAASCATMWADAPNP